MNAKSNNVSKVNNSSPTTTPVARENAKKLLFRNFTFKFTGEDLLNYCDGFMVLLQNSSLQVTTGGLNKDDCESYEFILGLFEQFYSEISRGLHNNAIEED